MEDEEDLYDCVYDDEDGGEIYEDLMKTEAIPPPVSPPLSDFSSLPQVRLTLDTFVSVCIKDLV